MQPLRALILEDNPDDAELLALELIEFGYDLDWVRVETEEDFVAQLIKSWDIILTDFSLPRFDALTAIRHVNRLTMDTPVVVVSGAIGEEQAVAAIREGATDYVNKAYRGRLGAAVRNALSRRQMQRAQREAQRKLARSEQQYRSLFEQNPDGVFALDSDGNFTSANESLARLTGYTTTQLREKSFESIIAGEDFERVVGHFVQTLKGRAQHYEARGIRQDGREFYADMTILPIVIDGDIVGVYGIAKDITQDKRRAREQAAMIAVAEALRTGESRVEILQAVLRALQGLFGDASVVFCRIDPQSGEITLEEGVGKGEMWVGMQIPMAPAGAETLVFDGRPFVKRQGREFARSRQADSFVDWDEEPDFSIAGIPVRAQDQVLGAIWLTRADPFSEQDISILTTIGSMMGTALQRAQYAEQLQQLLHQTQNQARQMQEIVDTVPEAVLALDLDHRIVLANRTANEMLPHLGAARLGDILERLGEHALASLLQEVEANGDWREFSLATGEYFEYAVCTFENTLPQPPGAASQSHFGGATGDPWPARLLVLRDITEERRRQEVIRSQERLATVGQLAAGIAHDFNNILAVISLYSGSLLKNPDLPKRAQYLETITRQTQHAATLIAQILDFGRRSLIELRELDMGRFLHETVEILQRTLPENIEITVEIEGETEGEGLIARADPTRIQQVLMNLAVNARDAMPDGGRIAFALRPWQPAAEDELPVEWEALRHQAGEWLMLSVRDGGHGIAQEHLPHIFEPFFTTKGPGQGTGLGLAQVYGIVKQHNGEIDVQSQPGIGTTFTILLPMLAQPVAEISPLPLLAEPPLGGYQKVLLIEDNPEAMHAIHDILRDELGYQVYNAESGAKALEVYRKYSHEIDLVLCDMVLPETDGIALYHAMSAISSSTAPVNVSPLSTESDRVAAPVAPAMILMSGYPLTAAGEALVKRGAVAWIQKPFTPDELSAKIQSLVT